MKKKLFSMLLVVCLCFTSLFGATVTAFAEVTPAEDIFLDETTGIVLITTKNVKDHLMSNYNLTTNKSPWYGDDRIKTVIIDYNVDNVGAYAFTNCDKVTSLSLSSTVATIGDGAFKGCTGLINIRIPSSVDKIGKEAFMDCTNVTSIVFEGNSFPTLGTDAFKNLSEDCKLYVYYSYVSTVKAKKLVKDENVIGITEPYYRDEGLTATTSITEAYYNAFLVRPDDVEEMAVIYNRCQRLIEGNHYLGTTFVTVAKELGTTYFNCIAENKDCYDVIKPVMEKILDYLDTYRDALENERGYVTGFVGASLIKTLSTCAEEDRQNALDYYNIIHMYLESKKSSSIMAGAVTVVGQSLYKQYDEDPTLYTDYLLPTSNNLIGIIDSSVKYSSVTISKAAPYVMKAVRENKDNYEKIFGALNVMLTFNSNFYSSEEAGYYAQLSSTLFDAINVDNSAYDLENSGTDLVYAELVGLTNLIGSVYNYSNGVNKYAFNALCKVATAALKEIANTPSSKEYVKGYINNFCNIVKPFSGNENIKIVKSEFFGVIGEEMVKYVALKNTSDDCDKAIGFTNMFVSGTEGYETENIRAFYSGSYSDCGSLIEELMRWFEDVSGETELQAVYGTANLFLGKLKKYEYYGSYAIGNVGAPYVKAVHDNYDDNHKDNLDGTLNVVLTAIDNSNSSRYERRTTLGSMGHSMFYTLIEKPEYYEQFTAEYNILTSTLYDAHYFSGFGDIQASSIGSIGCAYFNAKEIFAEGRTDELVGLCNSLLAVARTKSLSPSYAAGHVGYYAINAICANADQADVFEKIGGTANIIFSVCNMFTSWERSSAIQLVSRDVFNAYKTNFADSEDLNGMLNQLLTLVMGDDNRDIAYDIAEVGTSWYKAYCIDNTKKDLYQAKFNIIIGTFEDRTSAEVSAIGVSGGYWLERLSDDDELGDDYYDNVFSEVVKYVNCFDQYNRDCYGVISYGLYDAQKIRDQEENFEFFGKIVGQLNNIAHFDIISSSYSTGTLNPANLMTDYTRTLLALLPDAMDYYDEVMFFNKTVEEALKIDSQVSIEWDNTSYRWLGTFDDDCTYVPPAPSGDGIFMGWYLNYTYSGDGVIEDLYYYADFDPYPSDPDDPPTPSKTDPTYTVPTGITAHVGDTLGDVELPEGFTFQDPTSTPVGPEGVNKFKVTYTPTDTDKYNVIRNINVSITVTKETPEYLVPTGLVAKYGEYIKGVELPEGFTFQDPPTTKFNEVGVVTLLATYTPTDTDKYSVVKDIEIQVKVEKADPDYSITELIAIKGQTLGDVKLPEGFKFNDELTKSVGSVGKHDVLVTFTPSDTEHYNVLNNIVAILNVVKDEEAYNELADKIAEENKEGTTLPEQEGVNPDEISIVSKLFGNPEEVLKNSPIDYNGRILDLKEGETVGFVYSTKLMRTIDGISSEIQPKDLGLNSVKVRLLIPNNVDPAKITRLVQVHSDGRLEEYPFDQTRVDENGYYEIDATEFNEFAFLTEAGAFIEDDNKDEDGCRVHILFMIYAALLVAVSVFAMLKKKKKLGLIAAIVYAVAVGITAFFMGCGVCTTWLIIDGALLLLGMLVSAFGK